MDKELIKKMRQAVTGGNLELVKELVEINEGMLNERCWLHDAAS